MSSIISARETVSFGGFVGAIVWVMIFLVISFGAFRVILELPPKELGLLVCGLIILLIVLVWLFSNIFFDVDRDKAAIVQKPQGKIILFRGQSVHTKSLRTRIISVISLEAIEGSCSCKVNIVNGGNDAADFGFRFKYKVLGSDDDLINAWRTEAGIGLNRAIGDAVNYLLEGVGNLYNFPAEHLSSELKSWFAGYTSVDVREPTGNNDNRENEPRETTLAQLQDSLVFSLNDISEAMEWGIELLSVNLTEVILKPEPVHCPPTDSGGVGII